MSPFDFDDDVERHFRVDSVITRLGEGPNHHWPATLLLENGEAVYLHVSVTHTMVGLMDDAHLIGARFVATPNSYWHPHPTIPSPPQSLSEFSIGGRRFTGVAVRNSKGVICVEVG
ncbi:MAG: hypothetical protein ACXWP0_04370 [Ktedonobacterales bacterium]